MPDDIERARKILDQFPVRPDRRGSIWADTERNIAAALATVRAETAEACIHAIFTPPAGLYPDKTAEADIVEAAKEMGAVGAAGYFHERALHTAAAWHVATIRALYPTDPKGDGDEKS